MNNEKPKSFSRVPLIPLSYEDKDKAVTKELLVDYETGNVYIKNINGELINVFQSALKVDNQWITCSSMLNIPRSNHTVCGTQYGSLAIGGFSSEDNVCNVIEKFDGITWSSDYNITIDLSDNYLGGPHQYGSVGGLDEAYLFGFNKIYKYNSAAKSFSIVKEELPSYDAHTTSACGDKNIALIRYGKRYDKYNSITNTISTILNHDDYYSDTYYISGDALFGSVNDAVSILDSMGPYPPTAFSLKNDTLSTIQELLEPRMYFASTGSGSMSGLVYGGLLEPGLSPLNSVEELINGILWKAAGNMSYARSQLSGSGSGNSGLAVGGRYNNSYLGYTEKFNNIDALSYLKYLRDNVQEVLDAVSDKTISNVFDGFKVIQTFKDSTHLHNGLLSISLQDKIIANTQQNIISVDKNGTFKNLTAVPTVHTGRFSGMASNGSNNDNIYITQNLGDREYLYRTDQNLQFDSYSVSNLNFYNYHNITGKESGYAYVDNMIYQSIAMINHHFIKYNFAIGGHLVVLSDDSGLRRGCATYANDMNSDMYLCGGTDRYSAKSLITTKYTSEGTDSTLSNLNTFHYSNTNQYNLIKDNNKFIIFDSICESYDIDSNTWSIKSYNESIQDDYAIPFSNGNTSILAGAGLRYNPGHFDIRVFNSTNVVELLRNLSNEEQSFFNISKAEDNHKVIKILGLDDKNNDILIHKDSLMDNLIRANIGDPNSELFSLNDEDDWEPNENGSPDGWFGGAAGVKYYKSDGIIQNTFEVQYLDKNSNVEFSNYEYRYNHSYEIKSGGSSITTKQIIKSIYSVLAFILYGNNALFNNNAYGYYSDNNGEQGASISITKLESLVSNIIKNNTDIEIIGDAKRYISSGDLSTQNIKKNSVSGGLYGGLLKIFASHDENGQHLRANESQDGYMPMDLYKLLAGASSIASPGTLVKRNNTGLFYSGEISGYNTGLFAINAKYADKFFIKNSTANVPEDQTMSGKTKVDNSANLKTPYLRNISINPDSEDSLNNGDIAIYTY